MYWIDVNILHNECCCLYFSLQVHKMAANINQHASRAIYSRFARTVSMVFGSHITRITFATRHVEYHRSSLTWPAEQQPHWCSWEINTAMLRAAPDCRVKAGWGVGGASCHTHIQRVQDGGAKSEQWWSAALDLHSRRYNCTGFSSEWSHDTAQTRATCWTEPGAGSGPGRSQNQEQRQHWTWNRWRGSDRPGVRQVLGRIWLPEGVSLVYRISRVKLDSQS